MHMHEARWKGTAVLCLSCEVLWVHPVDFWIRAGAWGGGLVVLPAVPLTLLHPGEPAPQAAPLVPQSANTAVRPLSRLMSKVRLVFLIYIRT